MKSEWKGKVQCTLGENNGTWELSFDLVGEETAEERRQTSPHSCRLHSNVVCVCVCGGEIINK